MSSQPLPALRSYSLDHRVRTLPPLPGHAALRVSPEDFQVEEVLGFEPEPGENHLWLKVRKRNLNSEDVARTLARRFDVPYREIGYSGLKDRKALTMQWFSLPRGPDPVTWSPQSRSVGQGEYALLEAVEGRRKLRRGSHAGNRFRILLRDVTVPRSQLTGRLEILRQQGFPNYFGVQRFGRQGANLVDAERWFRGEKRVRQRFLQGILISAARAWIFNRVLSERVTRGNWNRALVGDALQLDGSGSFFVHDGEDADVVARIAGGDLHPTGPLWGKGETATLGVVRELETALAEESEILRCGLISHDARQARRALRVNLGDLDWCFPGPDHLQLEFSLPAGAYATSVIHEICDIVD